MEERARNHILDSSKSKSTLNFEQKYYYKALIQYNGAKYFGWQRQNEVETVQGTFEKTVKNILKSENISTIASGRTDTLVHSHGLIIRIITDINIPEKNFLKALSFNLPNDIVVKELSYCDQEFHPLKNVKEKEYHYYFTLNGVINPIYHESIYNFRFNADLELMKEGCMAFVGDHNFYGFSTRGSNVKTYQRTIYECMIEEVKKDLLFWDENTKLYRLKIKGNGFLKQMVRMIMGSLYQLGQNRITIQEISDALLSGTGPNYPLVVPGRGLHQIHVNYQN